jgi:hypothetical protein
MKVAIALFFAVGAMLSSSAISAPEGRTDVDEPDMGENAGRLARGQHSSNTGAATRPRQVVPSRSNHAGHPDAPIRAYLASVVAARQLPYTLDTLFGVKQVFLRA